MKSASRIWRRVYLILGNMLRYKSMCFVTYSDSCRRMLSIDSHPKVSEVSEVLVSTRIHNQFVINHKVGSGLPGYSNVLMDTVQAILTTIPAICIDITDKYHDDWFTEIVMIVNAILR
jgi:hypothetical protein